MFQSDPRLSKLTPPALKARPACAGEAGSMASETFAVYEGSRSQLPARFEYPAGWQVEYSTGKAEAFSQVQIYQPKSDDAQKVRSYMVVRTVAPKSQGGPYADLAEMIDSYKKTLMPGLTVDLEGDTTVLGTLAKLLEIVGTLRLPWRSPDAQQIAVRSQRLFFEKGGSLYELSWLTTDEQAAELEPLFIHLVDTLSILN